MTKTRLPLFLFVVSLTFSAGFTVGFLFHSHPHPSNDMAQDDPHYNHARIFVTVGHPSEVITDSTSSGPRYTFRFPDRESASKAASEAVFLLIKERNATDPPK